MSYDIYLKEPVSGTTVLFDSPHQIKGGTYCVGGTNEAWLNITWNYSKFYYAAFGTEGIRTIYGMSGAESITVLENAIAKLGNDESNDYWEATEGNAKKALLQLLSMAKMRPDAIWEGD